MSRKSKRTKSENEDLSVRRYARLIADPCRVLKKAGFCVWPSNAKLTFPTSSIDFDIPDDWKSCTRIQAVKLPQYRSLVKNFYRPPLQRGSCAPDDNPQCSCSQENGCDMHCQNRQLFMECAIGDCNSVRHRDGNSDKTNHFELNQVLPYCLNSSVQRRFYPKCEVFETGSCGYGLKVCVDVTCGTVMMEYTGEVITSTECSDRMRGMKEHEDFYFASLGGGLMLDAKRMGSVARFANHSCEPNCDLQKWSVLGESCIVLVAKMDLKMGTEMTYNYQYYNDGMDCIAKMKRQKCLCGSQRCSGTIGGRVVASDADTWLIKASNLLSGNRKYSRDTLNEHIRSSSSCKINPSCEELQSLKGMVLEADLWKTQRDELFEKAVRENVLLDSKECIDLLNSSPVGVRIEEWVHLDSLVKNVLRIEKVIRSLEGVTSVVVVENSIVDEVIGLLNDTEEMNSLDKGQGRGKGEGRGKGCDVSIIGVESSSSSSSVDHLVCGLRTEKELVNGHIDACTDLDLDPVTLQSFQALEELSFIGMNAGQQSSSTSSSTSTSTSSLIKDMIEDVMSDVISTDLNPFRSINVSVSNEEASSSISNHENLKCDTHDSVTNIDMKVEVGKEVKVIVDNKTSSNKADTRIHSVPSPQFKSVHWDEFITLLKDVASVLPVRCDRCEVLLEMYSNVNAWVKEHIGGLLHHSPNSRLHSTTTTTASSSSSSSTASASSSFASSSALSSSSSSSFPSSSSSSLHNSAAITTTTSAVETDNFQISKGGQICTNLNDSTLDVNKMNPLAAILSKISSVYRSMTLDLTLFIAEDFLQFRVGLYMERQDALRGEGRSNEIAESRKNMTLPTLPVPVSCTVATPQQLGLSEDGKKERDMICFCMMPSPMGETPILSQCDTCDRWYHPNCTNALLVSRTASQCAETFECPLCAHKKGKPSTIAYKPLSEWKLSIHSGIRMKGKSGGVNEIPEVLSSTKNDFDHLSNKSNAKECDMKQVQKKIKKERRDPLGMSLSKKPKTLLPNRESSIAVIKSECLVQVVDRQEDPLGPNITRALPDHGSPGASSHPLSYTVSMQNTSSSTAEVSSAMSSYNCNQKCSMMSLPALKADVIASTTSSTYLTTPENQSTPHTIIKAVVDPGLLMGSILTESVVPQGPIKSTLKKVKVPVVKPSKDPMTVTDVKCAMLSEKKMRFQKNPVVLLLGLCSVFIDEWRGRARSFMLREDVQLVVMGGVLGEITTAGGSDSSQTLQLSQYDNNVPYHSEGRLEREAFLLQECLQLYFEPRLLRIKPVETLDLRALAFLISASTTMAPLTVHTPEMQYELKHPLSGSPVYGSGTGTGTGDVNDPNRQIKTTADVSQYLITLKELKLIIEGGNYFLKLLKNEMNKKEDKPSDLKEADIGAVSSTTSKNETAMQSIKSITSKGDERSDLENVCRERLHDRIYFVIIKVSCRLDMCMKMLRVASEYRSSQRTFFKNEGDLLFNAVSEIDTICTTTSENVLCPIECSQNPAASCDFKHNFSEEIFKLDEAVESACQGIFIKDQYAYVRMKNILLKHCKTIPRNMNMKTEMDTDKNTDMHIGQDKTLKCLAALGYLQTSIDAPQKYCWCRGIDDGRPMVQCDGCDEWFHSACMGLCNTSHKSNIKSKKQALQLAVKDPLLPVCSNVMLDNDDAAEELIDISQNKIKKKGKIKFTTGKKSIEEINEIVKSTFYCIACADDRNEDFAFAWTTDNS